MERREQWPLGSNNKAKPSRLPEGFVRELVNMDARPTGEVVLRPGAGLVYAGTDVRWVGARGSQLLIVDGEDVVVYDTETDVPTTVGQVAGGGRVAGGSHNGELFFCTEAASYRYDGTLRPWGVRAPAVNVQLVPGSLPAGIYKVAATSLDARGAESGADVLTVQLDGTQALRVLTTDMAARVYVSAVNSQQLYYQGDAVAGAYLATSVVDDAERLETSFLVPPPQGHLVASSGASLLVAVGSQLWITIPYSPHLVDRTRGFLGFPARIDNVVAVDGGVFITADATYYVTGVGSEEPQAKQVADIPGVANTAVQLPDGRAAWFTEYGQAIGAPGGAVEFPNKMHYAPVRASSGAAGFVAHDGGSTVVTTLGAGVKKNAAATADFCDLEVVKK